MGAPRFIDWPCPQGWEPEAADPGAAWEFEHCVPPARVVCEAGEYQPIGSAGCVRLGEACPAGGVRDFHHVGMRIPGYSGELRHVADDAELTAALAAAQVGDVIALAVGEYAGPLELNGVALVGACPAGVVITSPTDAPGVRLRSGAVLKGVSLRGGRPGVLADGAGFALDEVEIVGAVVAGIKAPEARGRIRHVSIREVAWARGELVTGVEVLLQADITLRDVVVERFDGWGFALGLAAGGRAEMTDCVASELGGVGEVGGVGVTTSGQADFEVRRTLIDAVQHQGVIADGSSRLRLQDVVIRHLPGPGNALGIKADRVDLTVDRVAIVNVFGSGLILSGNTPSGRPHIVNDLVIRGTPDSREFYGRGIQLSDNLEAELNRVLIRHMSDVGVIVGQSENSHLAAGEVAIEDLVVRGIDSAVLHGGHGVSVDTGAQVVLRRARIEGNRSMGLTALGWGATPETRLSAYDVVVADTQPERCAETRREDGGCRDDQGHTGGGSGLTALGGARVAVDRFQVTGNSLTGVYMDDASVIRADTGDIVGNAVGVYSGPGPEVIDDWFGDVRLYGNDTDFARETLPLPDPARIIEF